MDAVPDVSAYLTADERSGLERVSVPLADVADGPVSVPELLESRGAFAGIIVAGLVVHHLALGGEPGLRILGPGDIVIPPARPSGTLSGASEYVARDSTRLALLDDTFLAAAGRAPTLVTGLHATYAEQIERLCTQLVICQLPRVADRVLAMLWLLAESFGRVTPGGTTLPLSLTHEVLGALVGARRPTVTLALGELADRGALVHQDYGWLLLERPERTAPDERRTFEQPRLLTAPASGWAAAPEVRWGARQTLNALTDTVERLRDQHAVNVEQHRDRLRRAANSRKHATALRKRLGGRSFTR